MSICTKRMEKQEQMRSLEISIVGMFFFFFFIFLQGSGRRSMSSQEYLLCLFFPDYDAFLMGVTLRNGQVTTQKRL